MTSRGGYIPHIKPEKEETHEIKGYCPNCCQAITVKIHVDNSDK